MPRRASEPVPESEFRPFISPRAELREFTARGIILGAILGVIFGASSLYLVLKVGMTVSASIPVAVISLTLFRLWSKAGGRDATVLENNIVQTAGSAGESIAFGLGVTMPSILILGFDLEITRVMLVGLLGALLGILMMIPLRRALIVAEHGELKYPEGTACADVLKAAADADSLGISEAADADEVVGGKPAASGHAGTLSAGAIFGGFGIGLVYKTLMSAFRLWKDVPEKIFGPPLEGGSISAEISPELLGVGYIIGPRIASIMMAGGVLNCLVLIPMIKFFGAGMSGILPPAVKRIAEMSPDEIRGAYILYIGAGAVAAGGIISLLRSLPLILHGVRSGFHDFKQAAARRKSIRRTDLDLPIQFVGLGILGLVVAIFCAPSLRMNVAGAILIVVFGFIFVAVSSRLTGEIGSSSNPISGMTVATLLLTSLIFLVVGWTGNIYYVTALSVGGIVCTAASNAGSTSQDLKTGFLLGATPKFQQIAILIGAACSALLLGPILLALNNSATVYVPVQKETPGLHAPAGAELTGPEFLHGPQGQEDTNAYRVWQKADPEGGAAVKYLVDASGKAVWLVDPGINGTQETRPDGTRVRKFLAPKATLMSYIIKGILGRKLPWALVLFGVMIAIVLELCGVSSLAFAVGVYLPVSSSTPVFVGGVVRWIVDRRIRHQLRHEKLEEDELVAEGDRSPGVLLASGYIAGGAIAGIVIAFLAGALGNVDSAVASWAQAHNLFYAGPRADWLALIPFAALTMVLLVTGYRSTRRERRAGRRALN
ncbi:MAG TPA: oligopeptide transporter, OPT family [Verrucomicrobiae bacterium]|nr:oligopeptide transporter, OPT family [Verrucomicrobiae bacterium]